MKISTAGHATRTIRIQENNKPHTHRTVKHTTRTPTQGKKNRHMYPVPTYKLIIHITITHSYFSP
jgi:hypothetical protein